MLAEAILSALSGATAQQPLALWQIAESMEDLTAWAGSVSKMPNLPKVPRIYTKHLRGIFDTEPAQALQTVYWPTGARPCAYPWKYFVIASHTQADACAARVACPDSTRQDTTMTDIPTPSSPRAKVFGDLSRDAIAQLDGIDEAHAIDAKTLHARSKSSGSLASTKKTLERLWRLGRIGRRVEGTGNRRRALHWDLGPAATMPPAARPADPPPAAEPTAEPTVERAVLDRLIDTPAGRRVRIRYGLFDDGSLEIWRGAEILQRLDWRETRQLARLLRDCSEHLEVLVELLGE